MPSAVQPIIDLLEVKMREIEKVIEQKSLIKNQQSSSSSVVSSANESSTNSAQSAQNKGEQTGEQPDAESKSWTTAGTNEALDETIINKNSFCIIIGSYIRRNAVSPKTVNLCEFQMLLSSYKAMFEYLGSPKNTREGESLITRAFEHKG
jgi:hypothetical protein